MDLSCFKAYDLRGRVPDQLNPTLAEKIGRAYVEITGAKKVIVGYDIRLSSPDITEALSSGLMAAGADVYDIGLCGTEQVYFATSHYGMDGGIMVTASHNPKDHNGMKMVGPESRPISSDMILSAATAILSSNHPTWMLWRRVACALQTISIRRRRAGRRATPSILACTS